MATNHFWKVRTTQQEVSARAGGRRRLNAVRSARRVIRHAEITKILADRGFHRGIQKQLAQSLGVSEALISKDIRDIFSGKPNKFERGLSRPHRRII